MCSHGTPYSCPEHSISTAIKPNLITRGCASDVGQEKCGDLKANWFMSDMATQYFGEWSSVFNMENRDVLGAKAAH